jgi:gas vesicle protein
MKTFLAGLGLGFGLGVLFAPMSGQELRENIGDRAGDIADTARDRYMQVKDTARSAISSVRGESETEAGASDIRTGTR